MTRRKMLNITLVCSLIIAALVILTSAFPVKSYGVPAYDGLFELKQPLGKTFEARKRGDEWYNWVETKEGYGIYKNTATENWEYYLPSEDKTKHKFGIKGRPSQRAIVGEIDPASLGIHKGLRPPKPSEPKPSNLKPGTLTPKTPHPSPLPQGEKESSLPQDEREGWVKRSAPNENMLTSGMGTKLMGLLRLTHPTWIIFRKEGQGEKATSTAVSGTMHLLIIGVDYDDTPATYTAEQIQPLVFGASSSVSDYYNEVSYSAVTISPATESQGTSNDGFIGWLRLSGNHPNPEQYTDKDQKYKVGQQIAKDAILAADTYIDYASYDTDGDGVVEPTELSIMIIVAGYEASTSSSSPSVWGSQGYMYEVGYPSVDGKTIQAYAEFGEKHGDHLATFGVMAHELGHLMFSL